jgi:hypothetical protein
VLRQQVHCWQRQEHADNPEYHREPQWLSGFDEPAQHNQSDWHDHQLDFGQQPGLEWPEWPVGPLRWSGQPGADQRVADQLVADCLERPTGQHVGRQSGLDRWRLWI